MDEGDNRSLIARHIGFSVGPSVVGLTSYAGMLFIVTLTIQSVFSRYVTAL